MDIEIKFLKNFQMEAIVGKNRVLTDQSVEAGGDGVAPNPFEYFMASVGLCSAHYVNAFCRERGISTDGIRVIERIVRDKETNKMSFETLINVPSTFPEKYKHSLVKVAEACTVKKSILAGPSFKVTIE